ncbi:hypothetical protein ACFIOY_01535 [Bradyrhizobium sp. TZ2]
MAKQIMRRIAEADINQYGLLNGSREQQLLRILVERLLLLLDRYEIPRTAADRFEWLALFLAIDHEPGFRVQKKSGRPSIHDNIIRDVKEIKDREGLTSDEAAMKALKRKRPKQYSATIRSLLASLRKSRDEQRAAARLREKLRSSSDSLIQEATQIMQKRV